ncbi:MAG: NAD-dependent epimerase/dehydratase [Conexibacter sp.]|nr:NAD-dependent epimerase/dehydratase [Conexibacter sp.]
MKRVLVTGAAGQLGREVVAHLADRGIPVTALELREPGDLPVDRVVVGSASDVAAVRRALDGADAVIHLAALREPSLGTAEEVFVGNTSATFTVLEQAARAGVRRAVVASSYALIGLPFATRVRHPAYLPIDEDTPPQIEDPYALSKQVDELVGQMMWWRHGLSVCALRFPFLGGLDAELPERARAITRDLALGATEMWAYLETRDGASACVAGLTEPAPGFHVVGLAAPETLVPYPTADLLDVFHPDVPRRRPFVGRAAAVDASRARALLNWAPEHLWTTDERALDRHALDAAGR